MSIETLSPVAPEERVEVLDVVRGFALFGILVANWRGFGWPAEFYGAPGPVMTTAADRAVQTVIDLLFTNKFITLFSFLFGIGFAIQMERAESRGVAFAALHARRMVVLLLLGLAHGWLLWWGDILATYAVAGLLLLLFRRSGQRTVLGWGIGLQCLPLVLTLWRLWSGPVARAPTPPPAELVANAARAYLGGSWMDLQRQLVHDWKVNNAGAQFLVLMTLGLFLLGLYVGRSGFLQRWQEEAPRLRRLCAWGLAGGLAGSVAVLAVRKIYQPTLTKLPGLALLLRAVSLLATPALSAAYAAGMALFASSGALPRLRQGLQAVGRTALSNYLLQSVVGTTLHYGYGFGLYGKVGAPEGVAFSLLVFALQMPLSVWWLSRFRFGPLEWLWRSLTYCQVQPMRIAYHRG